ncbi:MAG: hypothetical protein JHC98_04615 [Thermoleophilaceae bacterium]|nr:hypothetical protein [Thermoleophilaceae bacterium]
MDSQAIALEMPMLVDTDAPRRELVVFLSLSTVAVWAFAVISSAQALVI